MPTTLNIPLDQLIAAAGQFRQLEAEAESVRRTVDGSVRGIGRAWYGEARQAFDKEIDLWLADYHQLVAAPLTSLLNWFDSTIQNMILAEQENTQ